MAIRDAHTFPGNPRLKSAPGHTFWKDQDFTEAEQGAVPRLYASRLFKAPAPRPGRGGEGRESRCSSGGDARAPRGRVPPPGSALRSTSGTPSCPTCSPIAEGFSPTPTQGLGAITRCPDTAPHVATGHTTLPRRCLASSGLATGGSTGDGTARWQVRARASPPRSRGETKGHAHQVSGAHRPITGSTEGAGESKPAQATARRVPTPGLLRNNRGAGSGTTGGPPQAQILETPGERSGRSGETRGNRRDSLTPRVLPTTAQSEQTDSGASWANTMYSGCWILVRNYCPSDHTWKRSLVIKCHLEILSKYLDNTNIY